MVYEKTISKLHKLNIVHESITDMDEILTMYSIEKTIVQDKLKIIKYILNNIVVTQLEERDDETKIREVCREYLGETIPKRNPLSRVPSPPKRKPPSPLARPPNEVVRPLSPVARPPAPFLLGQGTSLNGPNPVVRPLSPVERPPSEAQFALGQGISLNGPNAAAEDKAAADKAAEDKAAADKAAADKAAADKAAEDKAAADEAAADKAAADKAVVGIQTKQGRLLLKSKFSPLPALTPAQTPSQSRAQSPVPIRDKATLSKTPKFFNITIRNITLIFDKKHGLNEQSINGILELIIFENDGIIINSPIGSHLNTMLYESITNKDKFNITEITMEGNTTGNIYYHFKPK